MTKELFETAVKDGRPVCYYLFRDLGLGKDCKYFVETGTHEGHSVQFALDLGFEEILSCEFMTNRYTECMNRFSNNDNVSLWCGTSIDSLPGMLEQINKRSCFWLDAHDEGGGVPTFEELALIKEHSIKDHTIIIDDVPTYFAGREKILENTLLSINSDYTLKYYKSINPDDDYVLAAYIE
jgi:hypothetical protein